MTLSLDTENATYLAERAQAETAGNVSAFVDRLVRQARLAEAVRGEATWFAAHPGYAEDAEAERHAA